MGRIKSFFKILGTGIAAGICWGLILGLTLIFAKHHPFWALFLMAAVSLALFKRLKKHWRARNWLPFFITFPVAFFCVGFPASLLWIAMTSQPSDAILDFTDALIFLFSFLFAITFCTFYFVVTKFWRDSRLARAIEQTKRGARIITNLNED